MNYGNLFLKIYIFYALGIGQYNFRGLYFGPEIIFIPPPFWKL